MKTVGVIQARTGSSRLPGKVMFQLGDRPVVDWLVQRVSAAGLLDEVIVATTEKRRDDIIEEYAGAAGASVYRGKELDVLKRVHSAAACSNADVVVRVCGDSPLIDPALINKLVEVLLERDLDYCSNTLERTFPSGIVAEAFTAESFEIVEREADELHHREHVTVFYHDHRDHFDTANVTANAVYDESWMRDRTDLRFAIDNAADFRLLREVFDQVGRDGQVDLRRVVEYVDKRGTDTTDPGTY